MDTAVNNIKPKHMSGPYICLFLGGLLWVLSLLLVAFQTTHGDLMGYWILATGWMGFSILQFAWYANLLQLLAVLLMNRHPDTAIALTITAVVVSGQAFWFDTLPGPDANMYIVQTGLGFWFWFISIVLTTFGVIFGSDEKANH